MAMSQSELYGEELRKCNLRGVAQALEEPFWKILLANIPRDLDSDKFLPKYDSDHIALIENAAVRQRRPCAEILFEEWSTSGKRRPTVKDLLRILIDAELFRAADVVSVEMLKGSPVRRPRTGPAAKVDVSIGRLMVEKDLDENGVESFLNQISYPSSLNPNVESFDNNLDRNNENVPQKFDKYDDFHPNIRSSESSIEANVSVETERTDVPSFEVSDMIKFSSERNVSDRSTNEVDIPAISVLLDNVEIEVPNNESSSYSNVITLNSDDIDSGTAASSLNNLEAVNRNIRVGSDIIETESDLEIPDLSMINRNVDVDIPVLSMLNQKSEEICEEEYDVPMLSALHNVSNESSVREFPYDELMTATNSFNGEEYTGDLKGRKIGSGGFGTVYLANGPKNDLFIVKRLCDNTEDRFTEDLVHKQFQTEIQMLSDLSHENVVSLMGYSRDGPYRCLVYEFVEGGSLQKNISLNKDLRADLRLNIAYGTAKGLEYLHCGHSKPLIHRDVKSANILLTKNYIPKLCDFGLIRKSSEKTTTTNVIGTTAYMAPEAFRGDVSVKMDVFSFGVVLLELLTSLPPMDNNRESIDLITHVSDVCSEDGIHKLLDKNVGPWVVAEELYDLALDCFEDKKKRPLITEIVSKLRIYLSK